MPGCGGNTHVTYTQKAAKMVVRRRTCLLCGTRFVTKERTLRITAPDGVAQERKGHGKNQTTAAGT